MNTEPKSESWWDDADFQDHLVALLLQDPITLKSCGALLNPNDFKPIRGMRNGRARWIVAERALEHYEKYHEPLGKLTRSDVIEYATRLNLGANQISELRDYIRFLTTKIRVSAPDALVEKVIRYKSQRLKASAIQELVDLQASGQLTDEKWHEIYQKALVGTSSGTKTTDYFETLEDRLERRRTENVRSRVPWTFIDPLDSMVRTIGPQQLGLILAPYKRGKSLMLLWLAAAYILQRLNVLYVTLEDTRVVCEDRLDSIITHVPLKSLSEYPKTVRRRFNRYKNMIKTRLKIFDGTEGGITVARIEQVLLAERDRGFVANALIVDYDEEIVPVRHYKERRFELDETYRLLRQLAARYNLVTWTAAQTQRDTRHLKILSGDRVAEDIGKIKKVTCAISMGKGEWTDDSIYLWIAAHKCDSMDIGCEIVPDLKRMLIYDREATRKAMKANSVEE